MSILNSIPTSAKEVVDRISQDVKNELSDSNPWLRNSFIRSIVVGLGNGFYDFYTALRQAIKQTDPFGATGDRLDIWRVLKNITPISADEANGNIIITGTIGTIIPGSTTYKFSDLEYQTVADTQIAMIEKLVSGITVVGTVATVTTTTAHEFGKGINITIVNAEQPEFNDTWEISNITAEDQFEIIVPLGTPPIGTGVISALVDGVVAEVQSTEKGSLYNQDKDLVLTVESTIAGADDDAVVTFDGITGGLDDETDQELRDRTTERWQNPHCNFNPAIIEATIKAIPGNTRVWVHRVTPKVGEVTIYFVRDNDDTIIPSLSQVGFAKQAIVDISNPDMDVPDIHVNEDLTGIEVDNVVTNITPQTVTMENAVKASIKAFYRGELREGQGLQIDNLKGYIAQTYDVQANQKLEDFTLNAPAADVTANMGEIIIEGTTSVG